VRVKAKALDELLAIPVGGLDPAVRPECHTAQSAFEVPDGGHGYGVDHLLMEVRVRLGWDHSILRQQKGVIQVNRRIEDATGGIIVYHLQVFTDRAGLYILPATSTTISFSEYVASLAARLGSKANARRRRETGGVSLMPWNISILSMFPILVAFYC
jgi:hypothetical protein